MDTLQRLLADSQLILDGKAKDLDNHYRGGNPKFLKPGTFLKVGEVPKEFRAIYLLRFLYGSKFVETKAEQEQVEFFGLGKSAEYLFNTRYEKYCQKNKFFEKYCESKKQPLNNSYLAILRDWTIVVFNPQRKK